MNKFLQRLMLFVALLLAGCARLQGPYNPPQVEMPRDWKNETDETIPDFYQWWTLFQDPILDGLVDQTLANNKSAAVAFQKMSQAFYQSRYRLGALFPLLTIQPSFFKQGARTPAATSGAGSAATALSPTVPPGVSPLAIELPKRAVVANFLMPLDFSWELDLWGKLSQNYYNAYYLYEGSTFDLQQVLNQISSDVVINYYLLRGYETEIAILDKLIKTRQDNFDVNKERYDKGLISFLDVTLAEVDLFSAKAEKDNVVRLRALQENIIAVLIGVAASDFHLDFQPLPLDKEPPRVPAGLPCALLFRRPDILSAEKSIAAFHANIGVAYAQFYPDITLAGTLGYSSDQLSTLFNWQSRLWQMAVSISQIIYNGGSLQANLDQTIAAYWESVSQYEKIVLDAIKDVEDSLVNIQQREKQEADLEQTVRAAQDTYDLSKNRYDSGLTNYLSVVVAEKDLLTSSRTQASVHSQRFVDTALLIKALGGSW